ncbi:MAG: retropepsin-like domain-containing protein [Gomphosphaeria aponina SAG 52.96 = DSM 107014]|uniref:Retropepsin-like domain-containing protein n=1 Tax=Gomphosphaeria aponina SAG 52.96 = DSM 107014 TaxID=1521640 RepID=A0A941JLC9_9CHRO|nr:retropepsin-like domain-containing protein [Gomphosphaeria aponina SAG 52.96 = DSM 107014]
MKEKKPQAWLGEIYEHSDLYEGKIIAILKDREIILVADSFTAAKQLVQEKLTEILMEDVSYFQVPRSMNQVFIPTLKIRSLRESLWMPMYSVNLRTSHNEIKDCQMLIDSGADISLITLQMGQELGLTRSEEEELLFARGIGGEIGYVLRRIQIMIDQKLISAAVAWCQDESINDLIIGRKDVFDAFDIEFRQGERRIQFTEVK